MPQTVFSDLFHDLGAIR